jgi:hypothetical protein
MGTMRVIAIPRVIYVLLVIAISRCGITAIRRLTIPQISTNLRHSSVNDTGIDGKLSISRFTVKEIEVFAINLKVNLISCSFDFSPTFAAQIKWKKLVNPSPM